MKSKFIYNICPWTILILFISVAVYFIVYNAQWLIGDDAIIISHTGIGEPFMCSETVWPEAGRFFPLAYQMYNVLLIFFDGYISPYIHYLYHGLCFILASFLMMKSLVIVCNNDKENKFIYWIAIIGTIFIGARVYSGFINCFSTTWFGYFRGALIIFSFLLFIANKKWIWGVLSLLLVSLGCYCGEVSFVLPLAWGVSGLLLRNKIATKEEKIFYWGLICSAVLFLILYYFISYIHIEKAYDPSHGTGVSIIDNALKILFAQKFLCLALIVFCVRAFDVIARKKEVTIYDILLLASAAHCVGGFILRLNWVLYYNKAIIYSLPAVIYFCNYYLKPKWTLLIILCFAIFYSAKLPNMIRQNQENRIDSFTFVNTLANKIQEGEDVYWYEPLSLNNDLYENVKRDWIQQATEKYLWYVLEDPTFKFKTITEYNDEKGYVLISNENEILIPSSNEKIINNGEFIISQKERGLKLYKMNQ